MASFSSGVMISKSEAERRRGDELRMRKQGLDPSKGDECAWGGAVVSRRQHRQTRVEKHDEKEREEAESLPLDLGQVLVKKPESRLKWLQRALLLAGKGRIQIAAVYDIVQHSKFVTGVTTGTGKQMRELLQANLHLFSTKQQRSLQSDSSKFNAFAGVNDSGRSLDDQSTGKKSGSMSNSETNRHRNSDNRDSRDGDNARGHDKDGHTRSIAKKEDSRRYARGAADDFAEMRHTEARSRSRHRRDAAYDSRQGEQKTGQLKISLQPWQPHCLRTAAATQP